MATCWEETALKLVINGDDLGYTKANTLGIIEAYRRGILRSTTALANSDYLEYAADKVCDCEGLGIGVHLTLTLGRPLTRGRSFVRPDGAFMGRNELYAAALDADAVYVEWKAQIERFIEVFGRMPTHLDSHHGVHDFNAQQLKVASRLASEYGLEMRRHGKFAFVPGFYGPTATVEALIALLQEHEGKDEGIEVMTHPGFCDLELYRASSYSVDRVRELDVLCDARLLEYVHDQGIELVHY